MNRLPDSTDWKLIAAIQDGLPLVTQPYAKIAHEIGITEAEVLERIENLITAGIIKRFGIVVRHRHLGYDANAMVVWDIDDEHVDTIGRWLATQEGVNLCYQRPRHPPYWPYNLFCMIHGRSRTEVLGTVSSLAVQPQLADCQHEVLFSRRCFKQCGARYSASAEGLTAWTP